jgi:hypothetical protein
LACSAFPDTAPVNTLFRFPCRTNELEEIICVLGIGLLAHLDGGIPVIFARYPEKLTMVVDVQENDRIGGPIINGDSPLLMAAVGSKSDGFI